jgi:hypothetical protein
MKLYLLPILLLFTYSGFSQTFVTRDIKSFGAKGDGKTNDHEAFQKAAAFFNARGGNGKLVISKGTYVVGKQKFNKNTKQKPVYEGQDLLLFNKIKNLTIEGSEQTIIKYKNDLYFGSFNPSTGKPYQNKGNFYISSYIAHIKNVVELIDCQSIRIKNLELDGNSGNFILGGTWGDSGWQLSHSGIWITQSTQITIEKVHAHHFGLDGIVISNNTGDKREKDAIIITNSIFEYNGRQGLSWVGGNDLTVIKSGFNHTGQGRISSSPGAGVDIEAEVGSVRNGKFIESQFINNKGCALLADTGPSSDCVFVNCLFWGVDLWSLWVRKPRFTFDNCNFYGSIVHGYNAESDSDATLFRNCTFEDKPYKNKEAYGNYLVESNYAKRMRFEGCNFRANKKNLMWMDINRDAKPEEKYQLVNCNFYFQGEVPPINHAINLVNCTFKAIHPKTNKMTVFYYEKNEKMTIK